jgi:hypothetical protein
MHCCWKIHRAEARRACSICQPIIIASSARRLPPHHGYILSALGAHNEPIYHSRVIKQRHCITSTTYKLQFICITKLSRTRLYCIAPSTAAAAAESEWERARTATRVCMWCFSLSFSAIIYHNISFITFSCCRRPLLHVHSTRRAFLSSSHEQRILLGCNVFSRWDYV